MAEKKKEKSKTYVAKRAFTYDGAQGTILAEPGDTVNPPAKSVSWLLSKGIIAPKGGK